MKRWRIEFSCSYLPDISIVVTQSAENKEDALKEARLRITGMVPNTDHWGLKHDVMTWDQWSYHGPG